MPLTDLNSAIKLHDSILASIRPDGGRVEITLAPGYIHKSRGIPGVDPGTVWVQNVALTIEDSKIEKDISDFPFGISDGGLKIAEKHIKTVLPLPLEASEHILLTLIGLQEFVVSGSRISAALAGDPKYVEQFSGISQ